MSHFNSSTSRPRPLSFGFGQQSQLGDLEGTFLSPATTPRSEASDPPSRPPSAHATPARWSRISSDYTALDGTRTTPSMDHDPKEGQDLAFISVDEIRADSDMSTVFDKTPETSSAKVTIRAGLQGIWPKLATHAFAVIVTTAIIQLSLRNIYWMDLKSPNELIAPGLTQGAALSFLQLAAKLHEILILASVSAIVVHTVQHHLTGRSGLPLGMIANAFELNSGQYLRTKSFWVSMWTKDPNTGKRFPFVHFWILTFFSMILVTLSGPSSAIAVIPSLNYFDLHHPFKAPVMPYYVFNHSTELWPQTLTGSSLNAPGSRNNCSDPNSLSAQNACPAAGFRDLYAWGGGLLFQNTDKGTNISYPDESGTTRRLVSVQSCNSTFEGRASGVSLNAAISGALTTYWNFAIKNFDGMAMKAAQPHITVDPSTEIFAPRVEILCSSYANYQYNASDYLNTVDLQPNMTFPTFDGTIIPVPDWTYKYRHGQNASNLTFVSFVRGDNYPSIGAVITLPIIELLNNTWTQTTENIACSIYSQWIPVTPFYEPTINDVVSYTITSPLGSTCLSMPSSKSGRKPINTTITKEYANGINQPILFVTGATPAIKGVFDRFINTGSKYVVNGSMFQSPIPALAKGEGQVNITDISARRQRSKVIASLLAGAFTDGMARIAGSGAFPFAAPVFLLPERNASVLQGRFPFTSAVQGQDEALNTTSTPEEQGWIKLNPTFQRYGYGYLWHGSRTTQFGICVLMVHVLCAVGHMCWLLSGVVGGRGVVKAWETIPEILALALGSRKAMIGEEKVWKDAVAVRETDLGELELVSGRESITGMEIPRVNRKYPP